MQVVKNDEAVGDLARLKFTKVYAFIREGGLLALFADVGARHGQVLVELNFFRLIHLILRMITSTSQHERVRVRTRALNVTDLNG